QQRRLRRLGKLQRKRVRTVQHPHAADLERAHVGERKGHRACVAAHIGRGARLVEIERCERRVGVGKRGLLQVDGGVAHAAATERLEEGFRPLRVFEKDGEFRTFGGHGPHVGAKVAGCKWPERNELMPDSLSGSCLCGSIRYAISSPPSELRACHCTHCQKTSGAGGSVNLPIPSDTFNITHATPNPYSSTPHTRRPL